MGQRRQSKQTNIKLLNQDFVRITKSGDEYLYEIGETITADLAEAVAILMRTVDSQDLIWKKSIVVDIDKIQTKKALYWLSGGDLEWITLHNYCKNWLDCQDIFEDEFGFIVLSIIKKSKKLEDIKSGFMKYLNLPTIYEFALEKNLVR
jgi:hypothetical protein